MRTTLQVVAILLTLVTQAQTTGRHSGPWEIEVSETTAGLRGVNAAGSGVVWASGTGGTVLRSEDSGYEWQPCALPAEAGKLDFRAVWAWNAQHALILSSGTGQQSRLYETTDGCSTWKLMFTNPDAGGFWDGLLFLNPRHGIIYGDPVPDGKRTQTETKDPLAIPIFQTADGGKTWAHATSVKALPGESSFAASNSTMTTFQEELWLGTSKARVLHSTDGGATWRSAQTPLASGNDSSGVFSLEFRDRMHGVAVGGDYRLPEAGQGTAAYTSDGGEHWIGAGKPPHGYRSAVAWDTKHKVWIAAGTNGSDISYDGGKTWQWLDSGNWNALSLPWVVGPHGQIGKLGTLPEAPPAGVAVSR